MSEHVTKVLLLAAATAGMAMAGCTERAVPMPRELLDARQAYQRAQAGDAPQRSPADLHAARVALERAEAVYQSDPESEAVKDYAYVAERTAERAEAESDRVRAIEERDRALRAVAAAQAEALRAKDEDRARADAQLREAHERAEAAEARNEDALRRLDNVREEGARGTVITLPTGILFATGKTELLPASTTQLDQVVAALEKVGERDVVVEGYTDSVGGEEANQSLSQRRAEAVRSYLVAHGLPPVRVSARGMGPARPLGDNATVEGRAKNRRVEIVIHPAVAPGR
jgi:outer membrane protein OmpA-like peptidoglycan-associated protein